MPTLTGDFRGDGTAVRRHTAAVEEMLAACPAPPERTQKDRETARAAHRVCDMLRARFMALHADQVYEELTRGRSLQLELEDLAERAAGMVPGLVPSLPQAREEQALPLAQKEGRDIAQGVFFQALLRSRRSGAHLVEAMLRPTRRARELLPGFRSRGRADLGAVTVERRCGVAYLTMCQPQSLNAENDACVAAMETAVDLALLDDGVRVGVLRGGVMSHPRYAGRRVFSSGINLKDLYHGRISFLSFFLRRELGYVHKLVRGLKAEEEAAWPAETVAKPWLAMVDTFAIGGGAQLLLVFDQVIAGTDSFISLPAAQEGFVPGAANLRLGRRTDSRLARQLLLGGRRIHAGEEAARMFYDEVVEPEHLDTAAERAVRQLDDLAVSANRHLLHLAEEPPHAFGAYMAEYALQQAVRVHSQDVIARLARFHDRSGRTAATASR
ncbi:(3,5-dihydroxyphenyl)acetyl-CoA 1,2-dioxygenase DpgC [Streptomyces nitrosporeus]|uniref:(3,5-dihydroxyphenyl)acetyl-CoA 1,2-dioxygenase DpgC n=1 Tax=Streptomyces nitrosporeus TaxID=28894 RepID=UPI0019C9060F|nr:(3,5-dihydroxyphenyl)acetyl-CoA 1,2-dioxygenase DpgC [Streptomyces nitrosporeus]GGZ05557.1 hypothetical protein GCM10010327_39990 [Streptomyces nitrosporeus]